MTGQAYGPESRFRDSEGRRYLADSRGTLRRVAIMEDGIHFMKPLNKSERKAVKRKIQRARKQP